MTSLDPVSSVVNGRYQLQHWMRRTALSDDYEAHDLLLDRTVVFKALLPDLVANRSFIERFRTQAQATANLTHPALASVLDWGRDPNPIEGHSGPTYYLVGERRTGRSLTDLLSTNGAMPIERAVHVLVGVTSALVYAHRSGVVHGGLTPDDITVSSTGVVKVHDIGLTGALGDDWRAADDQPGQALWRAPEQFRGEAIGPQTDVYQIGLIAYYLVTGRPPFAGSSVAEVERLHVTQIPAAPSKVNAAVPRAFEKIIGKAMTKNAVERYASMADLRAALVRFRESGAMSAGSASMGATAGGSTTGSTASGAGTGLGAGASMATGAAPSLAGASLIALSGGGPDPTSGGLRGYDATMLASTTPRSLGRRTNRGSDPAAMRTTARRDGDDWVLDGQKRWIGNGTIADVLVVWARDTGDGQVKGFLVEGGSPGLVATRIEGKVSVRAVWQADITMTGVRVPEAARLPGAETFKDTGRVLASTRGSVAWSAAPFVSRASSRFARWRSGFLLRAPRRSRGSPPRRR